MYICNIIKRIHFTLSYYIGFLHIMSHIYTCTHKTHASTRTHTHTHTCIHTVHIPHTYLFSYKRNNNIAHLCKICITDSAVVESSPVVGSSRNNIPGDTTISMAMLHRFLCPPETPRVSGVPIYIRNIILPQSPYTEIFYMRSSIAIIITR